MVMVRGWSYVIALGVDLRDEHELWMRLTQLVNDKHAEVGHRFSGAPTLLLMN